MKRTRAVVFVSALVVVFGPVDAATRNAAGAETLAAEAAERLRHAAEYYHDRVAVHGGYVYYYSPDLATRLGEGIAEPEEIWVQPPGTPTVGMAYLEAYRATGDTYYLDAATETARALIYGQLQSGGWRNSINFDPHGAHVAQYRNGKGKGRDASTLDDDISQSAIRFLTQVDEAHGFQHEAIHESVQIALDALLAAQFANGAFPQVWTGPVAADQPTTHASYPTYDWRTEGRVKNYWDMYTLNDGLAGTVCDVLLDAHRIYGDERYRTSLLHLGDFLLLAVMPEPQPAWAQQYSYDMHPIWARKFEPPAVAGRESEDAIETLLDIHEFSGDAKYLEPVPAAIAYLRRSRLPDGRLARYYELETNCPLYMQRRGGVYSLTHDDTRLPNHYGWKNAPRLDELEIRYNALARGERTTRDVDATRTIPELAKAARTVIALLDEEGRWMSTFDGERLVGQPKFRPGERYLSSAVFARHVGVLSEYLRAVK